MPLARICGLPSLLHITLLVVSQVFGFHAVFTTVQLFYMDTTIESKMSLQHHPGRNLKTFIQAGKQRE